MDPAPFFGKGHYLPLSVRSKESIVLVMCFFPVLLQYSTEQQCTLSQFYTVHYLLQFVYYYQYGIGMLKHF